MRLEESEKSGQARKAPGAINGSDACLTQQSLDAGELVDLVHRLTGR